MQSHIKLTHSRGLPEDLRREISNARHARGWSQAELGKRVGLPQAHISGIESGRVTPRYDTLLELVRVLGHDLLLTPRSLVPAVQALVGDYRSGGVAHDAGERPLYGTGYDHIDSESESETDRPINKWAAQSAVKRRITSS